MSTVFTLAGAFGFHDEVDVQLGGEPLVGNTVHHVVYPNVPLITALDQGADLLNDALIATSGHKIVFAHSLGALVAHHWLTDYAPDSTIPFADLEFILIGNPCRKYGGMLSGESRLAPYVGPLSDLNGAAPLPAVVNYQVRDLARQYDGWADWPNDDFEPISVANATLGANTLHVDYTNQSLDDPDNFSYFEGNIEYIWSRTVPMPMSTYSLGLFPDSLFRKIVEQSYDRPVDLESGSVPGNDNPRTLNDLDVISEKVEYYRRYKSQL